MRKKTKFEAKKIKKNYPKTWIQNYAPLCPFLHPKYPKYNSQYKIFIPLEHRKLFSTTESLPTGFLASKYGIFLKSRDRGRVIQFNIEAGHKI